MFKYLFLISAAILGEDNKPIVGAKVCSPQDTVYTDMDGRFSIETNKYIKVSYISYEDYIDSIKSDTIYLKEKYIN